MSTNLGVICRICMCIGENFVDIFTEKIQNVPLVVAITECAPVNVSKTDNLPNLICLPCLSKLEIAKQFRDMCILSDSALRSFIDEQKAEGMSSNEFVELPVEVELSENDETSADRFEDEERGYKNVESSVTIKKEVTTVGFNVNTIIEPLFACGVCNSSFDTLEALSAHHRVHRKPRARSIMNNVFTEKINDSKYFQCSNCHEIVTDIKEFHRIHRIPRMRPVMNNVLTDDIKYFHCSNCHQIVTDIKEQIYELHMCEQCGNTYKDLDHLTNHDCKKRKSSYQSTSVDNELYIKSEPDCDDYTCQNCFKNFKDQDGFAKHFSKCHRDC